MHIKRENLPSIGTRETTLMLDWIAITDHINENKKNYSAHELLHDFHNWSSVNGQNGYSEGAKHPLGVRAYRNPLRPDMGTHVIYTGKAIQKMNEEYVMDGIDILRYHARAGHSVTRLDIAMDFKGHGLRVDDFKRAFMDGYAETRLKSASEIVNLTAMGHTFYIGSRKSKKKLIRIYDKGAEQKTNEDWLRIELQIMGKSATTLSQKMYESSDVKRVLLGAIRDVINFPTIVPYAEAMSDCDSVRLGSNSSTKGNTQKWLMEQCLPALAKQVVIDFEFWMQFKLALNARVDDEFRAKESF